MTNYIIENIDFYKELNNIDNLNDSTYEEDSDNICLISRKIITSLCYITM